MSTPVSGSGAPSGESSRRRAPELALGEWSLEGGVLHQRHLYLMWLLSFVFVGGMLLILLTGLDVPLLVQLCLVFLALGGINALATHIWKEARRRPIALRLEPDGVRVRLGDGREEHIPSGAVQELRLQRGHSAEAGRRATSTSVLVLVLRDGRTWRLDAQRGAKVGLEALALQAATHLGVPLHRDR